MILGIDTSAIVCSVALIDKRFSPAVKTVNDGLTHSETLLPLIKSILAERAASVKDLEAIAISCGPGSFTGLRIGISTVKGLAVSHGILCIGVSTLEALAMNGIDLEGSLICPVMDARRGEFYNALFRVQGGELIRLCEDRALPGERIAQELQEQSKLLILGDGAEKFVQQNPAFSDYLAKEDLRYQSGYSVALLGQKSIGKGLQSTCNDLSPKYLRLPQAEREWNEKNKK